MLRRAFDQACFLMSMPFALLALVALGVAWLCQKVVFVLDPEWQEVYDARHKEITDATSEEDDA